jgi:hypothetical protein
MAVKTLDALPRPRWPELTPDPTELWLDFDPVADELMLYFDRKPVAAYNNPICAPEGDDVAVLVGLEENWVGTDQIVGIQIIPLLGRAVKTYPSWRVLAEPNPPPEAVASFVAEVGVLFARYGVGEG